MKDGVEEEEADPDADGGVGDVECGEEFPREVEGDKVEVELEEVGDGTEADAVDHVAECAAAKN